jgi:hypothetical protein
MSIFPNPSPGQGSVPPTAPPPPAAPPPPYGQPVYYAAPPAPAPTSGGSGMKTSILFGAVIALVAACAYMFFQIDHVRKDLAKNNDAMMARLDKLEETSSLTTTSNRKTVSDLKEQLDRARRQANAAAGEAKQEALKKVDETRAKLEEAQEAAKKELKSDISQVKDATESANSKISAVGTEVTSVKSDQGATKTQLEKTVAD